MSKHYCRIGKVISGFEKNLETIEVSTSSEKGLEFSNDESLEKELKLV